MAKPRQKAAKGYKHAVEFRPGEKILNISTKEEFELRSVIGTGGFGLIYKAKLVGGKSSSESFAVKIEPKENGPLFNESHVLQRIARSEIIDTYIKKKKPVRPVGIPRLFGNGIHTFEGVQYRFLVLPLFDVDLQKIFEDNGRCFEERTAYGVAVRMLDVLEYLDSFGYVHADLKAANILIRHGKKSTDEPSLFLIDYGLATRYMSGDTHLPYKPLKKNAHNGTLEYTSVDAHLGAEPARRGDLQILGFCLWEWLAGSLPWKSCMKNKDDVKTKKIKCLEDLSEVPTVILKKYFKSIGELEYDDQPNYTDLKNIFLGYLKKHGSEKLYIPTGGTKTATPKKTTTPKTTTPKKRAKPMRTIQNVPLDDSDDDPPEKPKPKRPRKVKSAVVKKK